MPPALFGNLMQKWGRILCRKHPRSAQCRNNALALVSVNHFCLYVKYYFIPHAPCFGTFYAAPTSFRFFSSIWLSELWPLNVAGSTEAIYFIEHMMEHVAAALKKPSLEVKRINFMKNGDKILDGSTIMDCSMDKITDQLLASSGYDSRVSLVTEFNQANRWRKRGLNVVPMRFPVTWARRRLNCLIAIFHSGGTVAVTHGGIELGQGINTKVCKVRIWWYCGYLLKTFRLSFQVAQVVAYELGIEMEYIAVQPNVSFTDANGTSTGGSVTSEVTCLVSFIELHGSTV